MNKGKSKKNAVPSIYTHPRQEHVFSFSENHTSFIRFPNIIQKRLADLSRSSSNDTANPDIDIMTEWKPNKIKEYIFGNNLEGPIREYLEPISADKQCSHANVSLNSNTTLCWLCGCKIGKEKKACEHIIPALRAIMFSGIITTSKITSRFNEEAVVKDYLMQNIKNNYLWAHDNCNSTKSGTVYIKFNKDKYEFEPDEVKCSSLVSQIVNLKGRSDCYQTTTRGENSIYSVLVAEMKDQCIPINKEFKEIGSLLGVEDLKHIANDKKKAWIKIFIQYTIDIIKLYTSQEALEKLLTPEEVLEKQEKEKKRQREEMEREEKAREELRQSIERMENSIREYYLSSIQIINKQTTDFYIPIFELIRLKFSYFFYWNPENNPFKKNKILPETTQLCQNLSSLLEELMDEFSQNPNINSPVKYAFVNIIVFEYLYSVGKKLGFSMVDTKYASKDSVILYGNIAETKPIARVKENIEKYISDAEQLHKKYLSEYLFLFLVKIKDFMYKDMNWTDFKQNYPSIITTVFSPYLNKFDIVIHFEMFDAYLSQEIDVRIKELIQPNAKTQRDEKTLEEIIEEEAEVDYDIGRDYVEYDIEKNRDWLRRRVGNINNSEILGKSFGKLRYDYENLSREQIDKINKMVSNVSKGRFGGNRMGKTRKRKASRNQTQRKGRGRN